MESTTTSADLLVALAGSALFWVTVAGIAIRALRIDFAKLEGFLKHLYERADGFTFSAASASDAAVTRTLRTLYGSKIHQAFLITLPASLILNLYVVVLFHADWVHNRQQITALERETIATVDPEYFLLTTSEKGRETLDRALHQIVSQAGAYYDNNDAESKHVRAVYQRFLDDLDIYALKHHISYDLTLARFFGDSISNVSWRGTQTLSLVLMLVMIIVCSAIVDTIAALVTIEAVRYISNAQYREALSLFATLAILFVLSLVNYGAFFLGYEGEALTILVFIGITVFYGSLIRWILSLSEPGDSILSKLLISVCGLGILGLIVWVTWYPYGGISTAAALPMGIWRHVIAMWTDGIDRKAVMMSMVTIWPMIAALSIALTIYIVKAILVATKSVILGQVYGASVVSGSTYFIGFLTTLISSTTVAWYLMKLLGHAKH